MPELRLTLLVLGVLFIAALAWWEVRRQRQAPRQGMNQGVGPGSSLPSTSAREMERVAPASDSALDARGHREPTISFPELQPQPRTELRAPVRDREPAHDPPVVELDDESFSAAEESMDVRAGAEATQQATVDESPVDEQVEEESPSVGFVRREEATDETTGEWQPPVRQPAPPAADYVPAGAVAAGDPIVDWPGEESRKIVALRLVSAPTARFNGRAVRQALVAEGFVLGKFDIFHKPGPDARAMLSAASLTKPGTFAMNTIDAQRFGGLSLFAVLPGPLPAQQTFDELLTAARNLNDRLQGALQDERGEPLTPMRSSSIRDSLASGPGSRGTNGHAEPIQ